MARPAPATALILLLGLMPLAASARAADPKASEREAMYHRYLDFAPLALR